MLRLLLDTHAFVWCLSDVPRLAEGARNAIADPRNDVFVSVVTGWGISIKRAKGRMTAPDNLLAMVEERGFTNLPLSPCRRRMTTTRRRSGGPARWRWAARRRARSKRWTTATDSRSPYPGFQMHDGSGDAISSAADDNSGVGLNARLAAFAPDAAGTYYIEVRDPGGIGTCTAAVEEVTDSL